MTQSVDKKQRIMKAAEQLFKARQFHEIALDEVAKEADVGKGTIYLYFSDKEDLFFQTAVSGFDDMCEMLHKDAVQGQSFSEELLQACQTITGFFQSRRSLFRMILAEGERAMGRGGGLRQRWLRHRTKMTAALAEIIDHGVQCGQVRRDLSSEVLVEFLLGMLRTRATEITDLGEPLCSHKAVVSLFINGINGTKQS